MSAQPPATPAQAAGDAAVQVGQVFGQGGTDGLILYALILATFLMFLALVVVLVLAFRAINRATSASLEQGKAFAEASNEGANALRQLATATAEKVATDATHRANLANTLARLENVLARVEPHE